MKGFLVHFDPQVRGERPNLLPALIHALEMQERTMAFGDRILGETGSLEMSVDVGGEDKDGEVVFANPFEQKRESTVGVGFAIKIEPVPIKAPSQSGGFPEPTRVGHLFELDPELGQGRVGFPKSRGASKIRQSRIDPHSRPRANQEGFRFRKGFGKGLDLRSFSFVHL